MEKMSAAEIVEKRMDDVYTAYKNAQFLHDDYMSSLGLDDTDPQYTAENVWIDTIDEEFDNAEQEKVEYIQKMDNNTNGTINEAMPAGAMPNVNNENKKKQYLSMRKVEKVAFDSIHESLKKKIAKEMKSEEPILEIIKDELSDLKRQYSSCKDSHQKYIAELPHVTEEDIQWVGDLQNQILEMTTQYSKLMQTKEDTKTKGIPHEKLKMPTFDGNIRNYPRFKTDFERQILPKYKKDDYGAAYALKSCLSDEPLEIVRNVDDNHSEMWKRLDEKYGKKSRFTDSIMNEIKSLEVVRNGDNKSFINMVSVVESGFRDLERLNLEEEIANSTAVSIIEDKLPSDIRRFWALEVSKTESEKAKGVTSGSQKNKFTDLLEFLLNHKRAIEYDCDNIRSVNDQKSSNKSMYNENGIINVIDSRNIQTSLQQNHGRNVNYPTAPQLGNNNYNQPINNQYSTFGSPNYYGNGQMAYGASNYYHRGPPPPQHQQHQHPPWNPMDRKHPTCAIHNVSSHPTRECREYIAMTPAQKIELVQNSRLCYGCLNPGHRSFQCRTRQKCNIDNCDKFHHSSLHEGSIQGLGFHAQGRPDNSNNSGCLLQIMEIKTGCSHAKSLLVFFDGGATISLITFSTANKLGLQGEQVLLTVTKVGGEEETIQSHKYTLLLRDEKQEVVKIMVYGISKISTEVKAINVKGVSHLFTDVPLPKLQRPSGEIDVLVGLDYLGFHPVREQASDHLLVMKNRFGMCLSGSHHLLSENTKKVIQHVSVHHISGIEVSIQDFCKSEAVGVSCNPRCGGCQCGQCAIGDKNYSLKEEHELKLIEEGLNHTGDHWHAKYPWIRNPEELIDNYQYVFARLKSLEKQLSKHPERSKMYKEQIEDMINRNAARKLTKKEIAEYTGPVYYAPHHPIWNPNSKSTPCRPVMDSSANCGGIVLNDFWAKGPDLINDLPGILMKFREGYIAITGDIRKMYHAIEISGVDMQTHRFLWRDMETNREPDVYAMTAVCFGDRPAGNIAIMALKKAAKMKQSEYPEAAETLEKNTYVDDVTDSVDDIDSAHTRTEQIDNILKTGPTSGFEIKEWTYTSKTINERTSKNPQETESTVPNLQQISSPHKVLGMKWEPNDDTFIFDVNLNFSPKRNVNEEMNITIDNFPNEVILTKRMIE